MTSPPAVSVVMPVFNAAETLGRAAASVLTQSFADLELILVDDGSSDGSLAAAEALEDPRVKILRHAANRGAAAARNTGVAAARADLIAFHDADDLWVFDKLERQVARLSAAPEAIAVYTGALFYDLAPEKTYAAHRQVLRRPEGAAVLSGDLHAQVIAGNLFNLPTLLLRRTAFEACGRFDPAIPANEDWEFSIRLAAQGPILFEPEPLYLSPQRLGTAGFDGKLSRSARRTLLSFVYILGKLKRGGVPMRVLRGHCLTTAALLRRSGRPLAARRYLWAALRSGANPLKVAPRLALTYARRQR